MTTSTPPTRRQLLARIALVAGAAYAAPVVAELTPAEAQPWEGRGARRSQPSRRSRPSRLSRRSRPSRPSRHARRSRPSRPSRPSRLARVSRPYWDGRPRRGWGDDWRHVPEWAARLIPR